MSIERLYDRDGTMVIASDVYLDLRLPGAYEERPFAFVNMAATADGRIVASATGKGSAGIGSETDRLLMSRLRAHADAVLLGAGTVRACPARYPQHLLRAVVTRSGRLPYASPFFEERPDRTVVFMPSGSDNPPRGPGAPTLFEVGGEDGVAVAAVLHILRTRYGVERLLIEGGADLNAQCFRAGIVDELFLTVAPLLVPGSGAPSITGVLPDGLAETRDLVLVSVFRADSELFLRYRTAGASRPRPRGEADGA